MDGTAAELPSLEMVVMATPLTLPTRANLPNAGQLEVYHNITRDKAGGSDSWVCEGWDRCGQTLIRVTHSGCSNLTRQRMFYRAGILWF